MQDFHFMTKEVLHQKLRKVSWNYLDFIKWRLCKHCFNYEQTLVIYLVWSSVLNSSYVHLLLLEIVRCPWIVVVTTESENILLTIAEVSIFFIQFSISHFRRRFPIGSQLRDHPYITSVYFWTFFGTTHPLSQYKYITECHQKWIFFEPTHPVLMLT